MAGQGVDLTAALAREGYAATAGGGSGMSAAVLGCLALPPAVFGAGVGLLALGAGRPWTVLVPSLAAYGALAGLLAAVAYRLLRRPSALVACLAWGAGLGAAGLAGLVGPRILGLQPPLSGSVLWAVLVPSSALVFHLLVRGLYFCRDCGTWGRARFTVRRLNLLIPESRAFVQLASGDVSPLLSASPVPAPHATAVRVQVRHCASCRRGVLSVARLEGRGGKAVSVPRLRRIELSPDAVRALSELARREQDAESLST